MVCPRFAASGKKKRSARQKSTPSVPHGDGLVQDFHLLPLIGEYILTQRGFICNRKL
jgi:hypothetical protein